jgi:heme/copper-type cytochrome/quinol oxidase subunit 2
MSKEETRRDFMRLIGLGGVVFASGLAGCAGVSGQAPAGPASPGSAGGGRRPREEFFFLQLSDTHWGFKGPPNPEADVTLKKTVATINAVARQPDFIVFTGDLTHTTDDPALRRARMAEFKQIVSGLTVKDLRFMPGEHDASLDRGEAYREHFGETHYAFDHKGVHFVALDNVSDPAAALGDAQLAWLEKDLERLPRDQPVVVFAHRPLFDLYPQWDWSTRDGARAVAILSEYPNVTVFYGHIHQEHHHVTGRIAHHSARSLVFPLPAPGAAPKRAPLPWDPASPTHGIGYRSVEPEGDLGYRLSELAVGPTTAATAALAEPGDPVVKVTARKFEFSPSTLHLRRGVPVVIELTALDHVHGFNVPALGTRADLTPGKAVRLRVVPDKAGTFPFFCDVFCGDGHEDMNGVIVVEG